VFYFVDTIFLLKIGIIILLLTTSPYFNYY